VAALAGTPVRVPLPGEPQGEAIAFGPDGTLLSGSETRGGVLGEIRAVPGAVGLVGQDLPAAPPSAPATAAEREGPERAEGPDRDEGEGTPEWLPAAVGGGIAVALLLLAAGLVAVRGMRRGR
jgi:hypothetical protein